MNIREQMDPLNSFKLQIESMFEKSFQELNLKNNLNKTILNNLMEAAKDQQLKIMQLDRNIQSLKTVVGPDQASLRSEVNQQEEHIYDNFNRMMAKLNQIEEGIGNAKHNLETYMRSNQEVNQKLDFLTNKLEKIEREEGGYEYRGTQQDLLAEVEDFQKLMAQLTETSKSANSQIDFNYKLQVQQPLNTFETKMMLHNKNNEEILRARLKDFTQKLRRIEKKVEETSWVMNTEFSKSANQQKRIVEEMNLMEGDMVKLRSELQSCEVRRQKSMQTSASNLDNLVEQMLSEAKKLQVRVDSLRRGYEQENSRVKKDASKK